MERRGGLDESSRGNELKSPRSGLTAVGWYFVVDGRAILARAKRNVLPNLAAY